MQRVFALVWKEFVELSHDHRSFGLAIVAPLLQLTLLGYAATTDLNEVPTLVVDLDRSAESRALVNRFVASPFFDVVDVTTAPGRIDDGLERGEATLAVSIPGGYGRDLAAGRSAVVQVIADGSDANSSTVALGYAQGLVVRHAEEILADRATATRPAGGLRAEVRVWFNPQLESRPFMIPGVLALVLLVVTTMLTSMAVVREKELGTLEQLNVTPLARWELIVGKLVPYALIGLVDVGLVLAVVVYWFDVPLRGSALLLVGISVVYILNTLALGLLVSTVSKTQQQAMMTAAFFVMMPMVYLSGFIFPIENMPPAIQSLTYGIPVRYYLTCVRGIMLKGVGLDVLWRDAAALLGLGIMILAAAVARSSKRAG